MRTSCINPHRIYQARLAAGMTQDDVAFRLRERGHKANGRSMRRWESGQHAPHANVVPDLAATLGVTIDSLYEQTDTEDDDEDDAAVLRRVAHQLIDRGQHDLAADLLGQVKNIRTRDEAATP